MASDPKKRPRPVVLVILDGWGHRNEINDNAIAQANTPTWHALMANYPHGLINASELHVGLPKGQMGNSEVGHMNIGSGRVIMQDLPMIDQAIDNGSFASNPELNDFIARLKASGGACHLLGLLSPGGVHSHQRHMVTLAERISAHGITVYIHAFLDGRDTPPKSADECVKKFLASVANEKRIRPATVSGRYYAMDRDKRWERVQLAYDALVEAKGKQGKDILHAIAQSYAENVTDEFVIPTSLGDYPGMKDGDGIVMANFRADRAREILTALLDPSFNGFSRSRTPRFAAALGLNEYSKELKNLMAAMFSPKPLTHILGEIISNAGMTQLRIAETEKYAHVTFFFNGGMEKEFPGESRILIPSPKVATYDLKPEMSAYEVTDKLVEAIAAGTFDFIVVNYANTDMVGHTGDLKAAKAAVEAVDACLSRLTAAVEKAGGAMLITADHGNAEMMHDPQTQDAHTAHTLNLVPVILQHPALKGQHFTLPEGKLADIAPTILELMGLPQPKEMTGTSLIASHAEKLASQVA